MITLLAGIVSLSLCSPLPRALPCTCIPGPPLRTQDAVRKAATSFDEIFEGRVLHVADVPDSAVSSAGGGPLRWVNLRATVVVQRRWKGASADTVTFTTPQSATMCGLEFATGDRVLIFAAHDSAARLTTSKCSPSLVWSPEAARLAQLLGPPR